jgi:hypothetical protein
VRFSAYAGVGNFEKALQEGGEPDLPQKESVVPDTMNKEGKAQAAAIKRNSIAMVNLTMAFTSEATMGMIFKAKTSDWPGGLAHLVMRALEQKYQPEDTITRVEMRQRLSNIKMKRNDDPATLFEQISAIENRFNTHTRHIEEEDLIAVVLDAAPQDYQSLLAAEQRIKGAAITLADLEAAMNQYWRQTMSSKGNKEGGNDDSEFTLVATKKKGRCWACGAEDHLSTDPICPAYKGGNSNMQRMGNAQQPNKFVKYRNSQKPRSTVKCYNCGGIGHIGKNCLKEKQKCALKTTWMGFQIQNRTCACSYG